MSAPFRITRRAKSDIDAILRYSVENWGLEKAFAYLDSLEDRFGWLAENPGIGTKRDELFAGLRSFPEGSHVIFYVVETQVLTVVRVKHRASDFSSGLEFLS